MTDYTLLASLLPAFDADDVTAVTFKPVDMDSARVAIADTIALASGVPVVIEFHRYFKGSNAETAKYLWNGGRPKVEQAGYRPSKNGAVGSARVTLPDAVLNDRKLLALHVVEAIVILTGLREGVKVTDPRGRNRAAKYWAEPCAAWGVQLTKLEKKQRDIFGRGYSSLTATDETVAKVAIDTGKVRAYLPKGATWDSEVARIRANNESDDDSAPQWAVNCICEQCVAEADGDTEQARVKNATRKVAIDLLRKDPMAATCRHYTGFRVVEGKAGKLKAESFDLRPWLREQAEKAAKKTA